MDPAQLWIASIAAHLTDTSMHGVQASALDPTLKDASINSRLQMQMEVFIVWYNWLAKQALVPGSKLPIPAPLNIGGSLAALNPANLGQIGTMLTKLLPQPAGAIAGMVADVIKAVDTPAAAPK